jgi:uncharacterized protein with HEPN domain
LAVIGETLNRVSAHIKGIAPEIEWREFYDLRNFIVHAYWQMDLEIIAGVIRDRLDPLVAELDKLIVFIGRSEK